MERGQGTAVGAAREEGQVAEAGRAILAEQGIAETSLQSLERSGAVDHASCNENRKGDVHAAAASSGAIRLAEAKGRDEDEGVERADLKRSRSLAVEVAVTILEMGRRKLEQDKEGLGKRHLGGCSVVLGFGSQPKLLA